MGVADRVEPEGVQLRVGRDDIRLDVLGDGLVHVALAQLARRHPGPVSDELVATAPRDAGEDRCEAGADQQRVDSGVVPGRQQDEELYWLDHLDAHLFAGPHVDCGPSIVAQASLASSYTV